MFCVVFFQIFGSFGVRSRSVRDPFGVRSGQFQTQISEANNFKITKIFDLCGRRRRGGGPLAAIPSPAARRALAAAAMAAQIENFCEKVSVVNPVIEL